MDDEGRTQGEITTEASRWDDRYGKLFVLIVLSMLLSAANAPWLEVVAIVPPWVSLSTHL